MEFVDRIIVGRGLAGTTLAWELAQRGERLAIIDREEAVTSSRIAAGLLTPITGQRLVQTRHWPVLRAAAQAFYQRVEAATGSAVFSQRPAVRILGTETERTLYEKRREADFATLVQDACVSPHWFATPFGSFEMLDSARLDVPCYLDAVRRHLAPFTPFFTGEVDPLHDVELLPDGVRLSRFGLIARTLIFCQGYALNPWFANVPYQPAKGEMLTMRIPGLAESRVMHQGVWLLPLGDDMFRIGATYEWAELDCIPTARRREELIARLRQMLRLPFTVIEHVAAVRPALRTGKPLLGLHPHYPQLGFMNGLGSKGSLLAPYFAAQFAAFLTGTGKIEPDVDLRQLLA